MVVAWAMSKLFRLKRSQGAFAIACSAFPNSNSLPVALMQSLVVSVKDLRWGEHDTKDEMLGRALSYLVLFSTLGIIARWSFGVKLLSMADDPVPPKILPSSENGHSQGPLPLASPEALTRNEGGRTPQYRSEDEETPNAGRQYNRAGQKASSKPTHDYFPSFPNTPAHHYAVDESDSDRDTITSSFNRSGRQSAYSGSDDNQDDAEWGAPLGHRGGASTKPPRSAFQRRLRRFRYLFGKYCWRPLRKTAAVVAGFMTVPLYAALLSLVVCCIPPLQHFLSELVPLKEALKQAGNCSIPLTLVVLGGFMHEEKPPQNKDDKTRNGRKRSDGSKAPDKRAESMSKRRPLFNKRTSLRKSTAPARKGETRTVIVAILSRMFITPALLLPLLWWFSLNESSVADDPVFVVTACLAIGSPPALTLAQITDAASGDAFERLISKTMLWAYAVVTPPTTIALVVLGLALDKADSHH